MAFGLVTTQFAFGILDQRLKIFIVAALVAGSASIAAVVFILKRIEQDNPERIRWK